MRNKKVVEEITLKSLGSTKIFAKRKRFHLAYRRVGLFVFSAILFMSSIFIALPSPNANADYPLHEPNRIIGNRTTVDDPRGIAEDSEGNLWIVDSRLHVTKRTPTGDFLMQFGLPGEGDGRFNAMGGLAIDSQDNIWVVDSGKHNIQKFDKNGNFLLRIGTIVSGTGDGQLKSPARVAVDASDNLYVTDKGNNRIQKFNSSGQFVWKLGGTVTGSADGMFNQPSNIAINSAGIIYVGDTNNFRIQKISQAGTFVGKFGQRNSALYCPAHPSLDKIIGMAFDSADNLYVTNVRTWCDNTYKFNSSDAYVSRLPIEDDIYDITIDSDDHLLAARPTRIAIEFTYDEIVEYDLTGTVLGQFGSGAADGEFHETGPMTEDANGNVFVVENFRHTRIQKFNSAGQHLLTFGVYGNADGQLRIPVDIEVDTLGNVYVLDQYNMKITKFDNNGNYLTTYNFGSGVGLAQMTNVLSLEIGADGSMYIVGSYGINYIYKFTSAGTFVTRFPSHFNKSAYDIVLGMDGKLYASEYEGRVTVYALDGTYERYFSTNVTTPGDGGPAFSGSGDIDVDQYNNVYLQESSNGGMAIFNDQGRFLTRFGSNLRTYYYSAGVLVRSFYMFVSRLTNEFYVNGDYDHVAVYGVAGIVSPPSAPLNVQAVQSGTGLMTVSWDEPATINNGPIRQYIVDYRSSTYGQWSDAVAITNGTTHSAVLHVVDDSYEVRVTAVNGAGQGPSGQTSGAAPISAPYRFVESRVVEGNGSFRAVAFDADDNRYVVDDANDQINVYTSDGTYVRSFASADLSDPEHIALSPDNLLYVSDGWLDTIFVYDLAGNLVNSFGVSGTGDGQLYYPYRVVFDANGDFYVINQWRNIQKFDKDGNFIERFAAGISEPTAIALDNDGNLLIANLTAIYRVNPAGVVLGQFGSYGTADGQFDEIYAMVVNAQDEIVISDTWNSRLQVFNADGTFQAAFGYDGSGDPGFTAFSYPYGLDIDSAGNLYVGDSIYYDGTAPYSYQIFSPVLGSSIALPDAPANPQLLVDSTSQLTVSWQTPADNGNSPITGYLVEHKLSTVLTWQQIVVSVPQLSLQLSSLATGIYDVRISTINVVGTGPPTPVMTADMLTSTVTVAGPNVSLSETGAGYMAYAVVAVAIVAMSLGVIALLRRLRSHS